MGRSRKAIIDDARQHTGLFGVLLIEVLLDIRDSIAQYLRQSKP